MQAAALCGIGMAAQSAPAVPSPPGTEVVSPRPVAATPAKPAQYTFDLLEIRVEGSTVLPQDAVEETIYPFLGPGRTAADVEAARAALEALYQKQGYATVSVTVPPQRISESGGVVVMQAIERRVERLRVAGAKYFLPSAVKAGAPSVAPGTVPNVNRLTRDLVGLNQLPDRTVTPRFEAGRVPDTVDVTFDETDKFPLHGSLELNNRYNSGTTPLRVSASLSYGNFFQRGDTGTISYQVAPENVADAEVTSASYLFHIPASEMSLLVSYLHSNSNVTTLGSTDVAGRGTSAGFRLLVPLGSTTSFSHSFSVGWDYKRYFELDTFLSTKQVTLAPVTYYPLNATYAASWTGTHSSTDATISAELGLSGLGSNDAQFDNKRYQAPSGFSILRAGVTREQDLPHDVQLWGSVQAQVTDDPLVSSEQISLGGADSLRGYLEAETLGDYGAYLQSELRSPSLAKYLKGPVKTLRFHLFADTGLVGVRDRLPGSHGQTDLSSAGIGARVNLWGYLNGSVQDAQALNTGPDTKAGTNRVLFRVYGEF
jgi:hemolysin activation/secretion protein